MTTEYEGCRHPSVGWRIVAVCAVGWLALLAVAYVVARAVT